MKCQGSEIAAILYFGGLMTRKIAECSIKICVCTYVDVCMLVHTGVQVPTKVRG